MNTTLDPRALIAAERLDAERARVRRMRMLVTARLRAVAMRDDVPEDVKDELRRVVDDVAGMGGGGG